MVKCTTHFTIWGANGFDCIVLHCIELPCTASSWIVVGNSFRCGCCCYYSRLFYCCGNCGSASDKIRAEWLEEVQLQSGDTISYLSVAHSYRVSSSCSSTVIGWMGDNIPTTSTPLISWQFFCCSFYERKCWERKSLIDTARKAGKVLQEEKGGLPSIIQI